MSGRLWDRKKIVRYYRQRWSSQRAMKRLREKIHDRTGRNRVGADVREVIAGQTALWSEDWFNGHGLYRLRGTICYPKAA
jgi:RNA-directed DNA polymerase